MNKDLILEVLKKSYDSDYLAKQLAYKLIKELSNNRNDFLEKFMHNTLEDMEVQSKFQGVEFSLEDVQKLFEDSIDTQDKKENGIVYTPNYIVDFIIENTIDLSTINQKVVLDPACGCGAFLTGLISKLDYLSTNELSDFISNNLYGFDLNPNCKNDVELVLNLQMFLMNKSSNNMRVNIEIVDSLFEEWEHIIGKKPDYIIGNPPYVKVQNLKKDYLEKLKTTFFTTKSGGFNLFYAFIEKSMNSISNDGKLGFITPNNFLKIKSGFELRKYISENKYLKKIIDFGYNMIFAPVMTYNCILFLQKETNEIIDYTVFEKSSDIKKDLSNLTYKQISVDSLDNDGWLLLPESIRQKINIIESFKNKIDKQIKTGIATLRDKLYIIDKIKSGRYYKVYNNEDFEIEFEILRPLYKVSDISDVDNIKLDEKFIIFPYDDWSAPDF